jgi:hypothetical protein
VSVQHLHGLGLVGLGQRGVPYDVREHYRSESALAIWHFGPVRGCVDPVIYRFITRNSVLPWPGGLVQSEPLYEVEVPRVGADTMIYGILERE